MCTDERLKLVGKIRFENEENKKCEGSGFLIDKNIVITACHNIKAYKNLNKDFLITFKNKNLNIDCKILEVIDYDESIDIAIIKIDSSFMFERYFTMVEFPILNSCRTTIEGIEVNIIGFRNGEEHQDIFSGIINNSNPDESIIINYNRDMNEESFGLSGSPIVMKETLYVYGLNIKQHDPDAGLHLKSIITYSHGVRSFLFKNSIPVKKFESHKLIEKDIYKEQLLKDISNVIETKDILDRVIKRKIVKATEKFIGILKDMNPDKFEMFINSIKLNGKNQNKFELDSNYKESILHITEIICHISILELTYQDKEITFEMLRAIKIRNEKYISYIYPFEINTYMVNAHKLFRYMLNNQECNFDGINQVILGNTLTNGKCRGCSKFSTGVKININNIIENICDTDGYDMDDDDDRLDITKVKTNLEAIDFHCSNCLTYDDKNHIDEVKVNVKNILGE